MPNDTCQPQCTNLAMIRTAFKHLMFDERGTSAVEMGLICSLIVLGMISALQNVASETQRSWNLVASKSAEAINQSTGS